MLSNAILLFLIIDPFGLIPVFLGLLKNVPPERRGRVIVRELLFALAILLVFLFLGRHLLGLLHISESALSVAGAIILFLIALPMVFPSIKISFDAESTGEPFIVPLATPMIAGPSALATVLLIGSGDPDAWPSWVGAVILAWLGAGLILLVGDRLAARIGKRGLVALERLMGMLLVAIAVEMFLGGLTHYLESIAPSA